jgi:nucleoside-diphosphate-sugar epimerase
MKHLITGGSGFLGNLIMRQLISDGEEVKVLDIWKDINHPKDVEFIKCDIRDREGLRNAMRDVDIVHHNVALVPLTKSGKLFNDVNVNGSRIAAEEAKKADVSAFIHMSSSAIYGAVDKFPITENTKTTPIEIYGSAKLAGEEAVLSVLSKTDVSTIIIRPRTILGQGRLGIFQILFDWINEGKNVYVIGSGNVKFQFIHAHDLMSAYMLLLKKGKSGKYNVGTDNFGTLRNAIENVITHANSKSKVKSLPQNITITTLKFADWLGISPLAPWHYLTYHKEFYFDITELKRIGWEPKYSNDLMFSESYDWFIKNRHQSKLAFNSSPHRKPVKESILKIVKWLS